jgi:hypothetical protein
MVTPLFIKVIWNYIEKTVLRQYGLFLFVGLFPFFSRRGAEARRKRFTQRTRREEEEGE